jgi:hypothetical protein
MTPTVTATATATATATVTTQITPHYITPHHTTSHHITPHYTTPHHITSHHFTSHERHHVLTISFCSSTCAWRYQTHRTPNYSPHSVVDPSGFVTVTSAFTEGPRAPLKCVLFEKWFTSLKNKYLVALHELNLS